MRIKITISIFDDPERDVIIDLSDMGLTEEQWHCMRRREKYDFCLKIAKEYLEVTHEEIRNEPLPHEG